MTKQDARDLVEYLEEFIEAKIDARLANKYSNINSDKERKALRDFLSILDFSDKDM